MAEVDAAKGLPGVPEVAPKLKPPLGAGVPGLDPGPLKRKQVR